MATITDPEPPPLQGHIADHISGINALNEANRRVQYRYCLCPDCLADRTGTNR